MRKFLSLFLVFCLIFSISGFAFAATNTKASVVSQSIGVSTPGNVGTGVLTDMALIAEEKPATTQNVSSEELAEIIKTAKSIITVPTDFSEFNYSMYTIDNNGTKTNLWSLNWSTKDGNSSISINLDKDGYVTNYYKYAYDPNYSDNESAIFSMTKDEALKISETFMAKAMKEYAKNMKIVNNSSNNYYGGNEYYFQYQLYEGSTPVNFVTASTSVNKKTKEVTSFYAQNYNTKLSYPVTTGIISESDAQKAYIKEFDFGLKYFSYYDYQKKTLKVFPVYVNSTNYGKAIDAKTGKPIDLYYGDRVYAQDSGATPSAKEEMGTSDNSLTPEEQIAVDNIKGLITKEEAEKAVKSLVSGISSGSKVSHASLYQDYVDHTKYIWNLSFENSYAQINAKTSELISFSIYSETGKGTKKLSEAECKAIAEKYLNSALKDKFSQTKFQKNTYYGYPMPLDTAVSYEKEASISSIYPYPYPNNITYSFTYERYANGIPFNDNNISVSVDSTTGLVINMYSNWYDNVKFPSISNVIGTERAFSIIDGFSDFTLMYGKKSVVKDKNTYGELALIYGFAINDNVMIDPFSGKRINYNGEPYKTSDVPYYTDISGHWSESYVIALLENGYYMNSADTTLFSPNAKISQLSFLQYVLGSDWRYASQMSTDDFYNNIIASGIVKKDEKAPEKIITKQEATVFVTRLLGYEKLAQKTNMFVYPFKDSVPAKYKSYVSIIGGLGIISGDKAGKINGANDLTNAQAATIIYKYLQNR